MDVEEVFVENPEHLSVIVGQTHFIKTAEDFNASSVPSRFARRRDRASFGRRERTKR